MGKVEQLWRHGLSRRQALAGLASFLASSPLLNAQRDPWPLGPHRRFLGFDEMRDVFDFEPLFRANVPLSVAMTDAIVEPIANSIWYFILDKFWTSKVMNKR